MQKLTPVREPEPLRRKFPQHCHRAVRSDPETAPGPDYGLMRRHAEATDSRVEPAQSRAQPTLTRRSARMLALVSARFAAAAQQRTARRPRRPNASPPVAAT